MARLDTRLEAEGAEFLVLGQLLLHKIASYKTYTNMPGYDLVATNPESNRSAMVQVKVGGEPGLVGFPSKISTAILLLWCCSTGVRRMAKEVMPPNYFVFPVAIVESAPRSENWGKVNLRDIPNYEQYEEKWHLIANFLREKNA